jgi:4-amino-4-deoxy-L-arabinose transferase-like glycosyltransferase
MPAAASSAARAVLVLIVTTAVLRVALAAILGLSVDESYTVAIGREFAWSYFDHPPLHVWLVGGWARLLGSEQPLLLRLPDIVFFAGSTWLMYRLTASPFGERAGMWAALAFNLAPLFTLAAAGGIVPDGPLLLCALLAVRAFAAAVLRSRAPADPDEHVANRAMIAAGAATGLALLCKYTAVSLPLSLALFLASSRPQCLKHAAPWLAALVAALLFAPVIAWNEAHRWVSFAFQGGRAQVAGFDAGRALWEALGEIGYLLPWIALALLAALARALRRGPRATATWLFACLAVLPLAAFALLSLWAPVLPHWAALGWVFTFPLLGREVAARERLTSRGRPGRRTGWQFRGRRAVRRSACATAVFVLCATALFASQVAFGWIERLAPAFAAHDPSVDFLDWRALRSRVAGLAQTRPGAFVATVSWIDAGKADYALGGAVPVLCLCDDPRQFGLMYDRRTFRGRDAFIVADATRRDWLKIVAPHFQRIEPGVDVIITRAGRAALRLHTAHGYGFSGV